jgi:hypothetical protein
VVFFDHSSSLLRRVVMRDGAGFTVTLFSDWKEIAGVKCATKREAYRLGKYFGHWEEGKPHAVETLREVVQLR